MNRRDAPELHRATIGTNELLIHDAMIDNGVMRLKNASLLGAFELFAENGPDMLSMLDAQKRRISAAMNSGLMSLQQGWMVQMEAQRVPVHRYLDGHAAPERAFDDPTPALIEVMRRMGVEHEPASVFETRHLLFLTYRPSTLNRSGPLGRAFRAVFGMDDTTGFARSLEEQLEYFNRTLSEVESTLKPYLTDVRRLGYDSATGHDSLLQAVNFCINGRWHPCQLPDPPVHLDTWLARDLWYGRPLVYDGIPCAVLSIIGFPESSYAGMLAQMGQLPAAYRWHNRFLPLQLVESKDELTRHRARWKQQERSFIAQMLNKQTAPVNQHAIDMVVGLDQANRELNGGAVLFGHYTGTVVIFETNDEARQTLSEQVRQLLENHGFSARIEEHNALEALLGTFPGHGRENVRKPFISSLNYADFLPLSKEWRGSSKTTCTLYPKEAPALLQGSTPLNGSPFFLNLHPAAGGCDLGHMLAPGPPGAGKSTLLASLIAQFTRYPGYQVFAFDKGWSLYTITTAMQRGRHYDIGRSLTPCFCPLAHIDDPEVRGWAGQWIETLIEQAGHRPTPRDKTVINEALAQLAGEPEASHRTMSALLHTMQPIDTVNGDRESSHLLHALRQYTRQADDAHGPGAMFDADETSIHTATVTCFEIEALFELQPRYVVATLLYLFHLIEQRLHTDRPSLLVLDEAWLPLSNPMFRDRIAAWLRTLRKRNCAVVLATQQLSDIIHSDISDVLLNSCPTKILLPNDMALTPNQRPFYEDTLGLSEADIVTIAEGMRKKRDYFYSSPDGRQVFSLDLTPAQLCFLGISGEAVGPVKACQAAYGKAWPAAWLRQRGHTAEAEAWEALAAERQRKEALAAE